MGFRWVFLAFVLLGSTADAATRSVEGLYYQVWQEPNSNPLFFDTAARIIVNDSSPMARVELYGGTAPENKRKVKVEIPTEEIRKAERWMGYRRVAVSLQNGGRLFGIPQRIAVLSINGELQAGIEVLHSDAVPRPDINRGISLIRSVFPVSALNGPRPAVDPQAEALVDQRYMIGSVVQNIPAVPVHVFGARRLEDGEPAYLVMERRDLVNPDISVGRVYLLPLAWLRYPRFEEEYWELNAKLDEDVYRRGYRKFRQQVLMAWTHQLVDYEEDDKAPFETDTDRFARRAARVLQVLNGADDDEAPDTMTPKKCSDFLYLQDKA